MEFRYQIDGSEQPAPVVSVERDADQFRVTIGERKYLVQARLSGDGRLLLTIDGQQTSVVVAQDAGRIYLHLAGQSFELERASERRRRRGAAGHGSLKASMPGLVVAVLVKPGDKVTRGQALVLLEAMKMEMRVVAPQDGTVQAVRCEVGQVVERDQVLVEFRPAS